MVRRCLPPQTNAEPESGLAPEAAAIAAKHSLSVFRRAEAPGIGLGPGRGAVLYRETGRFLGAARTLPASRRVELGLPNGHVDGDRGRDSDRHRRMDSVDSEQGRDHRDFLSPLD